MSTPTPKYRLSWHAKMRYKERFGSFPLHVFLKILRNKSVLIATEGTVEHRLLYYVPQKEFVLVIVDGFEIITIMLALERYPSLADTYLNQARINAGQAHVQSNTPTEVPPKPIILPNTPWKAGERIYLKCVIQTAEPQVYEFFSGKPNTPQHVLTPNLATHLRGILRREQAKSSQITYLGYEYRGQWYPLDFKAFLEQHRALLDKPF